MRGFRIVFFRAELLIK